jgi:hypothetical protein
MNNVRIARNYADKISYYEGYIAVILAFASIKMTQLHISILAHAALFEKLDKEIKVMIALRNNTNEQVVANGISKLRKIGHLDGVKVTAKLNPPKELPFSLTLILNVNKETNRTGSQEA